MRVGDMEEVQIVNQSASGCTVEDMSEQPTTP